MNKVELLDVLNNLYKSNENVILIDGKWGSGKTYLINEFIKSFDKLPIYYVSMLGARNVDDINTSLYMEVNKDNSINKIVPSVINPLKVKFKENTSLDFILKKNNSSRAIIIFDDFERYGSSDYDSFLSYVSNLVLSEAKIVVVSNLKELGGGEKIIFDTFKEKIFDHIYKADLFSTDVIEYKLHEFYKYITQNSLEILKSNIRIVDKLYNFLSLLDKKTLFYKLSEEKKKEYIEVIIAFISIYYNESRLEYTKENVLRASKEEVSKIKNIILDTDSYWEVLHIYEFLMNKYSFKYINNLEILVSYLYLGYVYSSFDNLIIFINEDI